MSDSAQQARTVIFETLRDFDRAIIDCAQSSDDVGNEYGRGLSTYDKVQQIREYRDQFFERASMASRELPAVEEVIEQLGAEAWRRYPSNAELALVFTAAALHGPSLRADDMLSAAHGLDDLQFTHAEEESFAAGDARSEQGAGAGDDSMDDLVRNRVPVSDNDYGRMLGQVYAGFYRLTLTVAERMTEPEPFYAAMHWIKDRQGKALSLLGGAELEQWTIGEVRERLVKLVERSQAPAVLRKLINYDALLPRTEQAPGEGPARGPHAGGSA